MKGKSTYLVGGIVATLALLMAWVGMQMDAPSRVAFGWIMMVILCLWMGNWYLNKVLDKRIPWQDAAGRRFAIQMMLGITFSLACINLLYLAFKWFFLQVGPDLQQIIVLNVYGLLFLLPVISVHVVIYTTMLWRRNVVYTESLKQAQVKSDLESLKSHLDPHFLFNNLNILSSLIDINTDRAQEFLGSFSEVYRYVLRQRGEELVPLYQELEFLEAYVFMLRQRFPTQILLQMEIDPALRQQYIPPLALQILIENAIKHNKATDAAPLTIEIQSEGNLLIVRNTLQLKTQTSHSEQFGLSSLQKRYEYLAGMEIEVSQTETHFQVILPLISVHHS